MSQPKQMIKLKLTLITRHKTLTSKISLVLMFIKLLGFCAVLRIGVFRFPSGFLGAVNNTAN